MKKTLMAFIAVVSMLLIVPHAAHSMSLSIGVTGWYAWWDFALKDLDSGKVLPFTAKNKFTLNPAPIYGPVVTFGINREWSVSALFLCGSHYRTAGQYYDLSGLLQSAEVSKEEFKTKSMFKYDLDTSVSYSPLSFFKIFVGFKVQSVREKGISRTYVLSPYYARGNYDYRFISYGPGLGIGFTAPLGANFFLLFNASGLYMRSTIDNSDKNYGTDFTTIDVSKYKTKVDLNVWGGNTSLGIAYVIEKASVTLSLGCRYQFLKNYMVNYRDSGWDSALLSGSVDMLERYYSDQLGRFYLRRAYTKNMDHLWGITLAALYTVNFSK
jgi:hypothetical protein